MTPLDIIAGATSVAAGVQAARLAIMIGVNWRASQRAEACALTCPDLDWEDRIDALEGLGLSPQDQYRLLKRYYGAGVLRRLTAVSPRLASLERRVVQGGTPVPREPHHG